MGVRFIYVTLNRWCGDTPPPHPPVPPPPRCLYHEYSSFRRCSAYESNQSVTRSVRGSRLQYWAFWVIIAYPHRALQRGKVVVVAEMCVRRSNYYPRRAYIVHSIYTRSTAPPVHPTPHPYHHHTHSRMGGERGWWWWSEWGVGGGVHDQKFTAV